MHNLRLRRALGGGTNCWLVLRCRADSRGVWGVGSWLLLGWVLSVRSSGVFQHGVRRSGVFQHGVESSTPWHSYVPWYCRFLGRRRGDRRGEGGTGCLLSLRMMTSHLLSKALHANHCLCKYCGLVKHVCFFPRALYANDSLANSTTAWPSTSALLTYTHCVLTCTILS